MLMSDNQQRPVFVYCGRSSEICRLKHCPFSSELIYILKERVLVHFSTMENRLVISTSQILEVLALENLGTCPPHIGIASIGGNRSEHQMA